LAANGVDQLERGEALALEEVFGPQWHQIPRLPLRYFVGEFGSAGLLTAATILLSLAEGTMPPTVQGLELTGQAGKPQRFAPVKKEPIVAGMAIGSTFGGGSACLVVAKQQE
jgi:3-oxoacyl-(acyl-carrier-protein) synthase